MSKKRILLLLKPFNVYPNPTNGFSNPKVLGYLDNRRKVHKDAIRFCENVMRRKSLDWKPLLRNNLLHPIRDVDMVITIGGDGTLLQASHFMDDSIPVLGVNSDPTVTEEVEEHNNEFDATRSTGYLCAATVRNFEQVLDDIMEGEKTFSELSRISIYVNRRPLPQYALNDLLIAHPCPATVSRFSYKIEGKGESCSPLVHCRSSGFRVSTAAGSTAAMLSSGGFSMPITSQDLQYLVREPILQGPTNSSVMHGLVRPDESMRATWYSQEGVIYIDGSHVFHSIQNGDSIEISSQAPGLKVFLPNRAWT
ncbi:Nadh kinase [Thalictrum thalictroides]|uniref:NADH kinase n=1 Tax=Thalictrum thalictroides TaxID=46969 RepID=A0A7J6UV30_THATH|nr:Nadh kinase [Thalictrum thalictroides]